MEEIYKLAYQVGKEAKEQGSSIQDRNEAAVNNELEADEQTVWRMGVMNGYSFSSGSVSVQKNYKLSDFNQDEDIEAQALKRAYNQFKYYDQYINDGQLDGTVITIEITHPNVFDHIGSEGEEVYTVGETITYITTLAELRTKVTQE